MAKKETKKEKKPDKVKEPKKAKGKKGAAAATTAGAPATGTPSIGVPTTGTPSVPLSQMSPDQMTTQQLEQAIKESQDPEARLKKLRSPLNVRSCLLNILFLIILTLGIVILWCWIEVDKFNFGTVVVDMLEKFGIKQAFEGFWVWLTGVFGGG